MTAEVLLSDLFAAGRVARGRRPRAVVAELDGRLAWVCPGRSSEWFRVTSATPYTLHIFEEATEATWTDRDRRHAGRARRAAAKIAELGERISHDYKGKDLVLVGVLKGAVFFLADLARTLTVPCAIDFMAVTSYGSATDSSGVVRILKDLDHPSRGATS